jgi:hypothetical protein
MDDGAFLRCVTSDSMSAMFCVDRHGQWIDTDDEYL